jgi:hypothetical protein
MKTINLDSRDQVIRGIQALGLITIHQRYLPAVGLGPADAAPAVLAAQYSSFEITIMPILEVGRLAPDRHPVLS